MKCRILVIDDSESVLTATRLILEHNGYEVLTSVTPLGMTKLILEAQPNLILLDIAMPAMGGERLLSVLRKYQSLSDVRVVFHSGKEEDELREMAESFGADGFIKKSLDPEVLPKQVAEFLSP